MQFQNYLQNRTRKSEAILWRDIFGETKGGFGEGGPILEHITSAPPLATKLQACNMGCTNDNAAAAPIFSAKMPKAGFGEGDVEGTQVVSVGSLQRLNDWTAGA